MAACSSSAEKALENIADIESLAGKAETAEAVSIACAALRRLGPESIIFRFFVGIRQYGVRLIDLLESLLGFLVAGIHIRMIFFRKRPICFFYFIVRSVFGNAKDFIIVSHSCPS